MPYGSGQDTSLERRIATLERQVQQLAPVWYHQQQRDAQDMHPYRVRLAETWSDSPGSYPAKSVEPNVYDVRFLDVQAPATVGQQTLTYLERQADDRLVKAFDARKFVEYIPRGTVVMVVQVPTYASTDCRWTIIHDYSQGDNLALLRAYEHLWPGQSALAELMEWNDGADAWQANGEGAVYRIKDSTWSNCVLAGESVWCVISPANPETGETATYEVLGQNGLRRRAKATTGRQCGGAATLPVAIWGGQDPVPDPIDCTNNALIATATRNACLHWENHTRIDADDELWIQFDRNDRLWHAEPTQPSMRAVATINTNLAGDPWMCPDDVEILIQLGSFGAIDRCDVPTVPTSVKNTYHLAGVQGDQIELRRNMNVPAGDLAEWEIVQVEHFAQSVLIDVYRDDTGSGCDVYKIPYTLAVQSCTTPSSAVKIFGGAVTVATGITKSHVGDVCKLVMSTRNVCVVHDGGAGTDVELPFVKQAVVTDVEDLEAEMREYKTDVWVLCVGSTAPNTIVTYTTECPP